MIIHRATGPAYTVGYQGLKAFRNKLDRRLPAPPQLKWSRRLDRSLTSNQPKRVRVAPGLPNTDQASPA